MSAPFRLALLLLFAAASATALPAQSPGQNLSGRVAEHAPLLRADGAVLFFSRPDHFTNQGSDNAADVWVRERYPDGSWGRALNPGSPVNSFAHDRAVGLSPDGSRLAVVRTGAAAYLDLLEMSGRNWRIIDSWPLPEDVTPRFDLTFDANGRRLVYARYAAGHLDLYQRDALTNGGWSEARPLTTLNTPADEQLPCLGSDGRTLYFRRGATDWWRQTSPGAAVEPVEGLPEQTRQFAGVPGGRTVVAAVVRDGCPQLYVRAAEAAATPPAAALTRGYVRQPAAPGERVVHLPLATGERLVVRPDPERRYAVFLRPGEATPALAAAAGGSGPVGYDDQTSVYAGTETTVAGGEQRSLQLSIARRQRELDRLAAERRRFDEAAPRRDDPEAAALRDRLGRARGDTLPPSADRNVRYAAELAELERMKEKFRRQQAGRDVEPRVPTTYGRRQTAKSPTVNAPRRGSAAARHYQDSLRTAADVRAGLRRDNTPRPYQPEAWEGQLRRDLPRQTPLSATESERLDAEYEKQLAELEALQTKLRRLNGTEYGTPAPAAPAPTYRPTEPNPRQWSAKGGSPTPYATPRQAPVDEWSTRRPTPDAYAPAPTNSRTPYPAPDRTLVAARRSQPADVSFIPNTAYPDSRGYDGLDRLVKYVQQVGYVVDIRVHTPAELPPRAAQLLSEERAVTIREHLLRAGIPAQNFVATGYGNNLTGKEGERVEVAPR